VVGAGWPREALPVVEKEEWQLRLRESTALLEDNGLRGDHGAQDQRPVRW
jgi:hypothetical protein